MQTATRVHNFSAGPAVLPIEVLEEAQRDLVSLPGVGMSVLEISHRSKAFDEIIQGFVDDGTVNDLIAQYLGGDPSTVPFIEVGS